MSNHQLYRPLILYIKTTSNMSQYLQGRDDTKAFKTVMCLFIDPDVLTCIDMDCRLEAQHIHIQASISVLRDCCRGYVIMNGLLPIYSFEYSCPVKTSTVADVTLLWTERDIRCDVMMQPSYSTCNQLSSPLMFSVLQ